MVALTDQIFENVGITGIHLEDQINPKRCGHLDGKSVVVSHSYHVHLPSRSGIRKAIIIKRRLFEI